MTIERTAEQTAKTAAELSRIQGNLDQDMAIGHVKTAAGHLRAALAELGKAAGLVDTAELGRLSGIVSDATFVATKVEADLVRRHGATATTCCPGCGGTGTVSAVHASLRCCTSCGGLFTAAPVTLAVAQQFVSIGSPMQAEAHGRARYFDFDLVDGRLSRMHGWFDWQTRRVVQWG